MEEISPKIERLIDANLNRLKEGLRVIEDICRYIHNDTQLTPQIKTLRHQLQSAYSINRLQYRNIEGDTQKQSTKSELTRSNLNDLVIANFSRTQESSRVLEESFKLQNIELSELFKQIRYQLYGLEKAYFLSFN
ncbi:MAG: thiamine-phosphate pyrophosphorylase [Sulfurovum sp. FS06-10]|nr:MAG: thiamine-phosphate pyrophosphorylase [Sulfurovum sp. FS06-10]